MPDGSQNDARCKREPALEGKAIITPKREALLPDRTKRGPRSLTCN